MRPPSYLKGALLLIFIAVVLSLIFVSGDIGMWFCIGILTLAGLSLLISLVTQLQSAFLRPARRLYAKDFSLKFLATLMGFFLVLGTLLYLHVFQTIVLDGKLEGKAVEFSNAEYLLRSLICSLDLFMLDVDSNILDRLDGHAALKGWLAIQAALSFACTVAILVGLVYSRLHSHYRLNYATRITDRKNHLYLFFNNNEPSELLIKDIVKNDPKAVAVIIDEANLKDVDTNEWGGIISLIGHKQNVFKTAEKIGAHVTIASQQLDDIDSDIADREDFDAFGYLGIPRIKKLIRQLSFTSGPQLHIFFMGEDEELNIRNIIALAKDTTIMKVAKDKNLYHRIYCHARYNGPNRVIQDVALKKHLDIKIVDSSHIAIELLKLDPTCHPVNVVKKSHTELASVDSTLKTLIVGFGEVGRDAFRFLYEFGAFVDSKNPDSRSRFECTIVDKNIKNIDGTLMSAMPGVFDKRYRDQKTSIDFIDTDYNSQLFYTDVLNDEFLNKVNYIVISIGDNDEAIALASRLFNKVRRLRPELHDLRIFVRCTDDNKVEGIQKIADHYNYGYGKGRENIPVIRIFGQPENTYKYDLVVSDRLIEEGKLFHEEYRRLSGEGVRWDERHNRLTGTVLPDIEKLRQLRRQESQDIANALHAGTKMILMKEAMLLLADDTDAPVKPDCDCPSERAVPTVDWTSFYLRFFNPDGTANVYGSQADIYYPGLSEEENKIILNLAKLEHLRWNAAHELMGYVFNDGGKKCDERTMRHNCLCPWDKLDRQSDMITEWQCDYKKYDFCVVDTTIALYMDKLPVPESND